MKLRAMFRQPLHVFFDILQLLLFRQAWKPFVTRFSQQFSTAFYVPRKIFLFLGVKEKKEKSSLWATPTETETASLCTSIATILKKGFNGILSNFNSYSINSPQDMATIIITFKSP